MCMDLNLYKPVSSSETQWGREIMRLVLKWLREIMRLVLKWLQSEIALVTLTIYNNKT
jgi:hypothetical protein